MEKFIITASRIGYGIALIGLGAQQFFYSEFRPVILPSWHIPGLSVWAYLFGAMLIATGVAIVLDKKTRQVSLILGGIFMAVFLFGHVLYELMVDPYAKYLGPWTNSLKELALSGGAFVIAGLYYDKGQNHQKETTLIKLLEKAIPYGGIFFSISMIIFGIEHFVYLQIAASLVPAWIPGQIFWTYFAGVALIGSGLAIVLKIKLKEIAMLLGLMIFLWIIMLHIPRVIADPYGTKGNEVTSLFEAVAFSGIGFMIAYGYQRKKAVAD